MVTKMGKFTVIIFSCLLVLFLGLVLSGCDNEDPTYKITTQSDSNGSIMISSETAKEDDNIMVVVSPKSGYELDQLVADPTVEFSTISQNAYSFIMPDEDVTIIATFKEIEVSEVNYNITIMNSTHGSISLSKNTAMENEVIYVVVSPDSGYELDQLIASVSVNINEVSENVYSFTMPNENISVIATFKEIGQEGTIEEDVCGDYVVSHIVSKGTNGSEYVPDMEDDGWRHVYISLNEDNTATIVTYVNYTADYYTFTAFTTTYESLGNGQYLIDASDFASYGFEINNVHISNDTLTFELSRDIFTRYYTCTQVEELGLETGVYDGTYLNDSEQAVIVNGETVTYNGLAVDYLFGSTAIIMAEEQGMVYIVDVSIDGNTISISGSAYYVSEDRFDTLYNDEFVKVD